ncbi:hypothetical protein DFJ74DRAFT_759726, partial [Hyaloraphidium curvatum]
QWCGPAVRRRGLPDGQQRRRPVPAAVLPLALAGLLASAPARALGELHYGADWLELLERGPLPKFLFAAGGGATRQSRARSPTSACCTRPEPEPCRWARV